MVTTFAFIMSSVVTIFGMMSGWTAGGWAGVLIVALVTAAAAWCDAYPTTNASENALPVGKAVIGSIIGLGFTIFAHSLLLIVMRHAPTLVR